MESTHTSKKQALEKEKKNVETTSERKREKSGKSMHKHETYSHEKLIESHERSEKKNNSDGARGRERKK